MKAYKALVMLCLLLLPLLLVACDSGGGDDNDSDGGDGGDNNASSVTLSQTTTFNIAGLTVSFGYPEGWVAGEDAGFGQIEIATSADLMASSIGGEGEEEGLQEGQATGVFFFVPSASVASIVPGQEVTNATDLLTGFLSLFTAEDANADLSDPQSFTVNGLEGAYVTGNANSGDGGLNGGVIATIKVGDDYVVLNLLTASDQSGNFVDEAQAILGSVTVAEGAG